MKTFKKTKDEGRRFGVILGMAMAVTMLLTVIAGVLFERTRLDAGVILTAIIYVIVFPVATGWIFATIYMRGPDWAISIDGEFIILVREGKETGRRRVENFIGFHGAYIGLTHVFIMTFRNEAELVTPISPEVKRLQIDRYIREIQTGKRAKPIPAYLAYIGVDRGDKRIPNDS